MAATDRHNASNWTHEEAEHFLSHLSEASFQNRTPVIVYLSLVTVVGLVGNILVLLVYGIRFRPSTSRTFILFMATLDFITNTLALPLQILTIRYAYNDNYWRCRSLLGFSTLSTQASGFLLVLVALDRAWRICASMRAQLDSRQAFYLAMGSVCFTVVVFAPFIPFYGIHRINTTQPGIQARMCWSEDVYKNTVYPTAYKITVAVAFLVGLSIMAVSYTCIGIKLWRNKLDKKSKIMPRRGSHESSSADRPEMSSDLNDSPQEETGKATTGTSQSDNPPRKYSFSNRTSTDPHILETDALGKPYHSGATRFALNQSYVAEHERQKEDCDHSGAEVSSHGMNSSVEPIQRKQISRKERRKLTVSTSPACKGTQRMRSRTTLIMSILTLFYIINWLPHLAVRAVRSDPVNWCDNFTNCGYNTYAIFLRSYYLNSAANAFVYSFFNDLFRLECREMFSAAGRKLFVRN